jgi:hypothetical protein
VPDTLRHAPWQCRLRGGNGLMPRREFLEHHRVKPSAGDRCATSAFYSLFPIVASAVSDGIASSGRFEGGRVDRRGRPSRSPPPVHRPHGTMISGRCPTGTSSASPSPTSSLISASPGNRHPLPKRVPPPLISRLPAAPAISSQTPPKRVPTPPRGSRRSRSRLDQPSGPRQPLALTPPWARRGA